MCWFALAVSSDQQKPEMLPTGFFENEDEYRTANGIMDVMQVSYFQFYHKLVIHFKRYFLPPRQCSTSSLPQNIETDVLHKPRSRDEEEKHDKHGSSSANGMNDEHISRNTQQINRIIGGGEAQVGRYPYLASLTKERSHTCGGTLIADDLILSAAHCGGYFDGVDLGRHDISDKTENMERYNIEKYLVHPQYKDASGSFDNDFMVTKLYGWSDRKVVRTNFNPNIPNNLEELYVAGWGVVDTTTDEMATKLKEVSVNYMTNEECKSKKGYVAGYSQVFTLENKITDNMICALDDGEDACQGDSGGPLIQKKDSAQFDVQVGVVSWGLGMFTLFMSFSLTISP